MMTNEEVQNLIGMRLEEARRRVEARRWTLRVIAEDGVYHPCTTDLRDDRVNVTVRAGKVEEADIG